MSKHKKSQETSKNDGRKNNKRLAPKPLSSKQKLSVPSRTTKAKKDRVESYAISAMKSEFGSEKDFFVHLAGQAKESFNALKLFDKDVFIVVVIAFYMWHYVDTVLQKNGAHIHFIQLLGIQLMVHLIKAHSRTPPHGKVVYCYTFIPI